MQPRHGGGEVCGVPSFFQTLYCCGAEGAIQQMVFYGVALLAAALTAQVSLDFWQAEAGPAGKDGF
ncbi:hypothetical protein RZS08_18900, partial [Arthrospira platensis SPKY1]|nr:hypothetical protein [Arthrospira platensis SPKY1]